MSSLEIIEAVAKPVKAASTHGEHPRASLSRAQSQTSLSAFHATVEGRETAVPREAWERES